MVLLKKFINDTTGATAIEYALIAALISIAIIAGATQIGTTLGDNFNNIDEEFSK